MIKILESDTIIDIVNKINNCNDKELFLEFPSGHNVLHNYMSLKILKSKAGNKKITILTHDLISKKIGTQLGINYSVLKDSEFYDNKNYKQELLRHNFTFFEYLKFELKKYITRFINFLGKKTGINKLKYYHSYNRIKKSGLLFLIFGLLTSIGMLIFIFYFAVSKTYIEITPEINIKTKAINIIYEENSSELSMISKEIKVPIKKIKTQVNLNYIHKTTGIDYENTKRATGEVEFINELREEQVFKPKTRLLNSDGLIFETNDWVKIPPRTINGSGEIVFGKTKANITARIYDINGKFIGSRGNIKESTFTIPGLRFSQDKIYAKLSKETTGGEDNISYIVRENDIENAKKIFEEMLKKEALNKIKQKIDEEEKLSGIDYEILQISDIIKFNGLEIKTKNDIKIGDKIENFELIGKIEIETYIFNKNLVLSLLKNVINDSLLSGTDKLMFINEDSLRTTVVLERTTNPLKIKATTEVDIGVSFDFDNNSNYYNQKLKTTILGLSNDEAKNILLNEDKINNVVIKNTPFFIKKVSSNIDNIIMKIKNEN